MDALGVPRGDGERAVLPAQQVGVEGAEQARGDRVGRRLALGEVDEVVVAIGQLGGDRLQPGPRVAQREAAPRGEVGGRGRAVAGQVAAGELGQRGVALGALELGRRRGAEPVAREREGVGAVLAQRTEDGHPAQRGEHEQVRRGLALGADALGGDALGQLRTGQRARVGQRALDDLHRPLGVVGRDALLREPPATRGRAGGRGEPQQPRIVLAADEVQRAAPQPGDDDGALVGERRVDIGRRDRWGTGAQRQARRTQVLGLHREQPPDDVRDAGRPRAVQQLRRGAGATQDGAGHAWARPRTSASSCAGRISGVTRRRGMAYGSPTRVACPSWVVVAPM